VKYGRDFEGLEIEVKGYKYNEDTNCIVVQRIAGNLAHFFKEFNRIKKCVLENL